MLLVCVDDITFIVRIKLVDVALLYRFVLFTKVSEFISIDNHIYVFMHRISTIKNI